MLWTKAQEVMSSPGATNLRTELTQARSGGDVSAYRDAELSSTAANSVPAAVEPG